MAKCHVLQLQSSAALRRRFTKKINEFFIEEAIGWQLVGGKVVTRGPEASEYAVKTAVAALEDSGRLTAAKHIHEALDDLSRRPQADVPGAMFHAMGSLECVARDVAGDPKATLGEILKSYPDLLPKPLDKALAQLWGYASNEARHVQEARDPNHLEAELLVGLSAVMSTYLTRKEKA
jgi:hypothetical protein